MTRDEIVTALRCCASIDGSGCGICPSEELDGKEICCGDALKLSAADLIENQQRHIEALLQANDALRERQRWIPVTERLPENATHPGAFCPAYLVATKCGITEGWYNPDARGWFIITKYLTDDYIDFEKGDIVRVKLAEGGIVTHWMPLPEAPEEDGGWKDA